MESEQPSAGADALASAAFYQARTGEATPSGTGSLTTVRVFRSEDAEAVRRICASHFRSLNLPAVQYYLIEHFRDLIALIVIAKVFSSWRELALGSAFFLTYLFVRAFLELEVYIYRDCPDLLDITGHYSAPRCRFWVAEVKRPSSATSTVVGCVGCCPARDDPKIAQLLRLVVKEDARRMRVGSRLLAQFEQFATANNFREVRLYTNNLNTNHIKFIRQHGYEMVHCVSRSLMRGRLIQWRKELHPLHTQAKGSHSATPQVVSSETPSLATQNNITAATGFGAKAGTDENGKNASVLD